MDSLKEFYARLANHVRAMTPGSRAIAGLLLLVVVISLGYLCVYPSAGSGDATPDPRALAATGSDDRATESGDPMEEAISRDKPWLFPDQRQVIYKNGEEKSLERQIADLFPDVAQATVTLSARAKLVHGRPRSRPIASVGVKMKAGATLDRESAVMICTYVAQAAGRDPANVMLFDPSNGNSYRGSRDGTPGDVDADDIATRRAATSAQSSATISNQPRQLPATDSDAIGPDEAPQRVQAADEPNEASALDPGDRHETRRAAALAGFASRKTSKPTDVSPDLLQLADGANTLVMIALGVVALGMGWLCLRFARRRVATTNLKKKNCEQTQVFATAIRGRDDPAGIELDGQLARRLIERHTTHGEPDGLAPFGLLRKTDSRRIARILDGESPQTIALVLSHLAARQAGEVIVGLAPGVQADVAGRLVDLEQTEPEVLREIERSLASRLAEQVPMQPRRVAGLKAVGAILEASRAAVGRQILSALAAHDESLAAELGAYVKEETPLLSLGDLARLDRAAQAELCQEAGDELLALALVGVPDELAGRLLAGLPRERAEAVRRLLDCPRPMRLSDVDAARAELIELAQTLIVEGRLSLPDRTPEMSKVVVLS